jgi:hypothetical protein
MGSTYLFCVFLTTSAAPAFAQTVDLSSRSFWVGLVTEPMPPESTFIAVRNIDWIESILSVDAALRDAVVHIELSSTPVEGLVSGPAASDVILGPDRLPPQYLNPDFVIYGPAVDTAKSFTYVPLDPMAHFIVECGERDDLRRMSLCVVYASYPPDDYIRLKARLYFPPNPADAPTYFRDVVDRMREVAYCLDVTDNLINVPEVYPDLTGCLPDTTS